MGKKSGKKGGSAPNLSIQQNATLREENIGKMQVNASSTLKLQHLQKLAKWVSGEAGVPPLGALLGRRLAATAEGVGVPLDSSCFLCQRCETMLQPGFNCTIRIEKNVKNTKRHQKLFTPSKNNIIYTCNFCSHRNLKWGTPKGHLRTLLALRPLSVLDSKTQCCMADSSIKHREVAAPKNASYEKQQEKTLVVTEPYSTLDSAFQKVAPEAKASLTENSLVALTPLKKSLSASKKKRKMSKSHLDELFTSGNNSAVSSGKETGGSSKRRRKSWSSLKEIAESNEIQKAQTITNFAIPFIL